MVTELTAIIINDLLEDGKKHNTNLTISSGSWFITKLLGLDCSLGSVAIITQLILKNGKVSCGGCCCLEEIDYIQNKNHLNMST